MNKNDFKGVTSTVVSITSTQYGSEIWVCNDDGREASYIVNDHSFRAREGQKMTAVIYGGHAVALRNDTAMKKIQLLTGEDLLGSGPQVKSKPTSFWLGWLFLIFFPGLMGVGILAKINEALFENILVLKILGNIICVAIYLAMVFGIPYWCIIRPRMLRSKHQHQIKVANTAIAEIFNPL